MVEVFNKTISKSDIVASPVDEILTGVVTSIEKGTIKEIVDKQYHTAFDNLDQVQLVLHYEVKFNDKVLKGSDKFAYYEEPMSNTKIGKFVNKYEELKVGVQIKVIYNAKGFGKIKVD